MCAFLYIEFKPKFKVIVKENIIAEYGEELDNNILFDAKKSDAGVSVKEVKDFDANKVGDQEVTVTFANKDGKTKSMEIKLTVKDTVKPEFVDFKKEITIERNAENVKLEDYFIAKDKAPVTISVDGKVDLSKNGKYEIKVTATDSNGNKTDAQSCVVVVATAKDVAEGKKLTATVKGEVPVSKETKEKVEKGEVKINVDKQSDAVKQTEKDQANKKEESSKSNESNTTNKDSSNSVDKKTDTNSTDKKESNNNNKPDSNSSNKNDSNKSDTNNNSNKTDDNSSNKGDSNKKDEPVAHQHVWKEVYKTVHHDEVGHNEKVLVKDAWDEEVPKYEKKYVYVCDSCGYAEDDDTAKNEEDFFKHIEEHMINGTATKGYHSEMRNILVGTETKHHEAEYGNKWVVDKKAYDEKVLDHYECSCGATKK